MKVLEYNILNSNIAVRKMLTTLAESTPREVETIGTEKVININIELGTTLEGHAIRHESKDLSTGHASRHEPNVLSPGHASQQDPIISDTEHVPDGHATRHTSRRPRTEKESKKKKRNKNQRDRRPMKQVMAVHGAKCDKSDLMCDNNKKQECIPNPSYSMMHALENVFSIVMYIGTHDTNMFNGCVHRNHAVRLILKKS